MCTALEFLLAATCGNSQWLLLEASQRGDNFLAAIHNYSLSLLKLAQFARVLTISIKGNGTYYLKKCKRITQFIDITCNKSKQVC